MRRAFIAVVFLLLAREAYALDPSRKVGDYTMRNWDVSKDMPYHGLNVVSPTDDGFLWAGAGHVLGWFDGVRFAKTNLGVQVLGIEPRAAGGVWVALGQPRTGPGVGWVSEDGKFHGVPVGESLGIDVAFRGLAESRDGTLWVGSTSGLFRVRGETVDHVLQAELTQIALARDGSIWCAGVEVTRVREGKVVERYSLPPGVKGWSIAEHPDGTVFVGTTRGLYRIVEGQVVAVPGIEAMTSDLHVDRDGSLWLATHAGLARWHKGVVSRPPASSPLAHTVINALAEDREGALWIATNTEGLWRLSDGPFTTIGVPEGLSHDEVWAIVPDGDAMWVGGAGGIDRVENGVVRPLKAPLPTRDVLSLALDRNKDLWVGMRGNLSLVAKVSNGRVTTVDLSGFKDQAGHAIATGELASSANGDVWVLLWREMVQFRDGQEPKRWDIQARRIYPMRDGRVLASTNRGLAIVSEAGVEVLPDSPSALAAWTEGDTLWIEAHPISGQSGQFLRKDGRVHDLADAGLPDDGLPSEANGIWGDDAGRIWFATNKGIYRVDQREVFEAVDGRGGPVRVRWFGTADGMRTAETNGNNTGGSIARDSKGRIWFATIRGVAILDPAKIDETRSPPAIRIRESRANGRTVPNAEFAAGTSRFEVDYTASGLRAPEKMSFKYRLEGFETDWNDAGARRTAYYTNVPPGAYTFRVIAANEQGVWNEEGASIDVRIAPHFWETWLFTLACSAGVLGLVAGGFGFRGRHLRARAAELERQVDDATRLLAVRTDEKLARTGQVARFGEFAASVAHNLKTPLTFIRGELELLDEKQRTGAIPPEALESSLAMSLDHCKRMSAEIDAGMSFVRPGAAPVVEVDVGMLLREIALLLRSRAAANETKIEVEVAGRVLIRGNLDNLRHAVANLVSNSIDAMPQGGVVTLSAGALARGVEIRVADTGPGVPESVRQKLFHPFVSTKGDQGTGLGLASCRRIVEEEHGGKIRLEPTATGAMFVMEIPG